MSNVICRAVQGCMPPQPSGDRWHNAAAVCFCGAGQAVVLEVPASINRYLREYQRDGIRFLLRQYTRKHGGILADDMGLGARRAPFLSSRPNAHPHSLPCEVLA